MADVAWPISFPQRPGRRGYDETFLKQMDTFETDRPGQPINFRTTTVKSRRVTMPFRFDSLTQFLSFESWWQNQLAGGSNAIIMNDVLRSKTIRFSPLETYKPDFSMPTVVNVTLTGYVEELT